MEQVNMGFLWVGCEFSRGVSGKMKKRVNTAFLRVGGTFQFG
jgi:hypothetical protein